MVQIWSRIPQNHEGTKRSKSTERVSRRHPEKHHRAIHPPRADGRAVAPHAQEGLRRQEGDVSPSPERETRLRLPLVLLRRALLLLVVVL